MNAPEPRRTTRPALLALALASALAGCKSRDGGGTLASRGSDPLFGGARIPRQDLPVPNRGDALASRDRRDPLLDSGVDRDATPPPPDRTERAGAKQPEGKSASRARTPFRPDRTATTAALAPSSPLATDDATLSIGARPGAAPRGSANWTLEELLGELTHIGVRCGYPTQEGGEYVLRGDAPAPGSEGGQVRRYEGAGRTARDAARSLLEQARADGVGGR